MDILRVTVHLFSLALSFWPTGFLSKKYILLRAQKETNAYRSSVVVPVDNFKKTNSSELQIINIVYK